MSENFFDTRVSASVSTEAKETNHLEISNELGEKDPYAKYRDSTLGTTKTRYFEMFRYFTNTPKSKYDGIVGWIKLR